MSDPLPTEKAQTEVGAAFAAVTAHGRKVERFIIDGRELASVPNKDGSYTLLSLEEHQRRPARLEQAITCRTAAAFVEYVSLFGRLHDTMIFADRDEKSFTAFLDYHEATATGAHVPARLAHTAVLPLKHPIAWLAWTGKNKQKFTQEEFAQFIEDHLPEIAQPAGATLLELVRNFEAKKDVNYQSSIRANDGNIQFTYNEIVQGNSRAGQMMMPADLLLALSPFEGSSQFPVTARMRWRLETGGKLSLWYDLLRVEDVLDIAFEQTRDNIKNGTVTVARSIISGAVLDDDVNDDD